MSIANKTSSQRQPILDIGGLPQQQSEVAIADPTINQEQQSKLPKPSKSRTQKPGF